jgi:hypothetical protein
MISRQAVPALTRTPSSRERDQALRAKFLEVLVHHAGNLEDRGSTGGDSDHAPDLPTLRVLVAGIARLCRHMPRPSCDLTDGAFSLLLRLVMHEVRTFPVHACLVLKHCWGQTNGWGG